jgi:cobalt-zinc-cadmium efflux system membrane fusion protein
MLSITLASCHQPEMVADTAKTFSLSDTMLARIQLDTTSIQVVRDEMQLNAKITPDESRVVDVYPIMGGQVTQVSAELGDYVSKGQVLAVIRSGEVAEIERELIEAQSNVALAKKNVDLQNDLFESKMASEREVNSALKELDKTQAELKRVEELFKIYSINDKSEYYVKAPIEGFLIEKNINRDMTLPPDFSNSIFKIARLDEVWTLANVYESDIARVYSGMEAEITTLSYPGVIYRGKIDKIFSVLNPETKTNSVRIKLSNPDYKLKPEMLAIVTLKFAEKESFPSVPASSVIFDHNKNYVMIFHDRNNIETREVQVYRTTSGTAWIAQGLNQGDIVISKNQLFIYDALND